MLTHLYDLIRERAARYPSAIAIGGQQELGWKTVTSHELLALVDALAVQLVERLGIAAGDRVVLWMPNGWRAPVYHFALWKLGAVIVPFDREMNASAAAAIIASVEPRCILGGYGEYPSWVGERGIGERGIGERGIGERDKLVEWWEPTASGAGAERAWSAPAEPLAAIFFTSGTTGQPKGCEITHANLCFEVTALRSSIPLDPTCRLASILPLSHLFELTCGLLYSLERGAAIHYIPSRRGSEIVRILREQRITHMIAVPQLLTLMGQTLDQQLRERVPGPIYRGMLAVADRLPLDTRRRLFFIVHGRLGGELRLMASGGAALPAETQRLWERIGVRIVQGYGTSECSPVVAAGAPDGSTPIGSVGKPLPGIDVRLSADGELIVRGPNVMRGYWKDPVRTAEVIEDGWYRTGDLAEIDATGNIRIVGRLKDLIVLPSGLNVWPQDVEDALRGDPAVKDAAIVAVPTPGGGAVLHAYLIPARPTGRAADLTAIVARANGRLALHQRIATASWWTSATGDFPRTSTLKVRRHLLPLPSESAVVKVDAALAADDPIGQALAAATHGAPWREEQTLAELGLDSLGLVELALQLEEKTAKPIGDGDLRLDMTVAQVRAYVIALPGGDAESAGETTSDDASPVALWPYRWGRAFRALGFPFEVLYDLAVTRTIVLGAANLDGLPMRVILAGTHRSYADLLLVRRALSRTPARKLANRLVVAAGSERYDAAGLLGTYATLAYGLYPLQQHRQRAASLRGLAQLAAAGNPVLIFPQGRHTPAELERADDPLARFRPGVAQLAATLDAVVVPFGLAGTDSVVPPRPPEEFKGPVIAGISVTVRRGPLAIAFGAPLSRGSDERASMFAARLESACFALARKAEDAIGLQM